MRESMTGLFCNQEIENNSTGNVRMLTMTSLNVIVKCDYFALSAMLEHC